MNFPRVTIQIVTYNNLKYLPDCLKSIFDQIYKDFQVLIVDNNSQDGTVDFLRQNYPEVAIFQNKRNLGFAKANNQGIKLLHSPYVVFCNPDVIMDSDWLENIMKMAESDNYKKFGSFGGKLLRLKIIDNDFNEIQKTDRIDSCGLKILKSHRIVELGAGKRSGKFSGNKEVFGQSAALALYRRQALNDCLLKTKYNSDGEYFDEDFFFYKEDVDLAWRLRLLGWQSMLVAGARAYHLRSLSGSDQQGMKQIFKNRKKQSKLSKFYSYRNHFLVLNKNQFNINFFKYSPHILWYEMKKFFYILFFEWSSLSALFQVIKLLPKILHKRKLIFKKSKINANDISKWIS